MRKKIRSEETVSFDIQSIAMHRMEPKALEIRFQCERKKREQRKAISYFFSFGSATIFIASTSDLSHFQALRHAVDVAVFFSLVSNTLIEVLFTQAQITRSMCLTEISTHGQLIRIGRTGIAAHKQPKQMHIQKWQQITNAERKTKVNNFQ